jgi:hypothetical protein
VSLRAYMQGCRLNDGYDSSALVVALPYTPCGPGGSCRVHPFYHGLRMATAHLVHLGELLQTRSLVLDLHSHVGKAFIISHTLDQILS